MLNNATAAANVHLCQLARSPYIHQTVYETECGIMSVCTAFTLEHILRPANTAMGQSTFLPQSLRMASGVFLLEVFFAAKRP